MTDIGAETVQRRNRWRKFMLNAPGAPTRMLVVRCWFEAPPRPKPWPGLMKERVEFASRLYEGMLKRAAWLKDDSLPFLDCLTGTEVFAEAMGCRVHYPDDSMPFALARAHSAADADRIRVPGLDAPPLARMFAMADELTARFGKQVLVRPVDIQSPMDIAALIWDKNDFYIAMIETPDAVKALAAKARALLTAFLREWYGRYGKEHVAHWPEYLMPEGITLSEDEIGVVSPAMFEEFFLPELAALSESFGGIGIHSCADSRPHWDGFKRIPGLRLLNLKGELKREAYSFFAPTGVAQWHVPSTEEEWDWVLKNAPAARVVVDVTAKDRDDALRLVEKYR